VTDPACGTPEQSLLHSMRRDSVEAGGRGFWNCLNAIAKPAWLGAALRYR
jgi:hypothetical protein